MMHPAVQITCIICGTILLLALIAGISNGRKK
jgi:ribosomal protein S27E